MGRNLPTDKKAKEIKMATFQNQATLIFGNERINSNTTVGEIVDAVSITKTAVSASYAPADAIAYVVSIENRGDTALTDISVTDNLGAYTAPGGATVIPLEYVPDTVKYYVNGELLAAPLVTAGSTLTFSGISVPVGGNAILVYEARVNGFAPLAGGSAITNTATVSGTGLCNEASDSASVPVREAPELSITKTLDPETVSGCSEITYSFIIQNTGNAPVVATDDLLVTDVFTPALSDITVTVDGEEIAEGTGYTYDEESGSFTTLPGTIPVPAASYETMPDGSTTVTPGVTVVTVTGRI